MKKLISRLLSVVALTVSVSTFAANGYFSSEHPAPVLAGSSLKATQYYGTDIAIINASNDVIYAYIPAGGFTDTIYAGNNDHITNAQALATQVILYGPGSTPILNQVVCPKAIIVVSGFVGAYQTSIDNSYCYKR